jgi:glycosyltransferase involved in cell wall biosynthesis
MEKSKQIVLISHFWSGIRSFILSGQNEFHGMPAFSSVFKQLLHTDDIKSIDLILFGDFKNQDINIPIEHRDKLKVFKCDKDGFMGTFGALSKVLCYSLNICLFKKVSLLIGHGPIGGLSGVISLITNVPNVRRLYGTFLHSEIDSSKLELFIRHPLEYLSFRLPAKALIITNDGTKGDLVNKQIGNRNNPFFFLLNGVDSIDLIPFETVQEQYNFNFKPDITYIARIDNWKRQHLLLLAVGKLIKERPEIKVLIIGQVISRGYFNHLNSIISKYEMYANVKIIEGVSSAEAKSILNNSKLSASFYDFSNLGNVFLESLVYSCVPITQNTNSSLEFFPKNVYINVDPNNTLELSRVIRHSLDSTKKLQELSEAGRIFAQNYILPWKERVLKEIDIYN